MTFSSERRTPASGRNLNSWVSPSVSRAIRSAAPIAAISSSRAVRSSAPSEQAIGSPWVIAKGWQARSRPRRSASPRYHRSVPDPDVLEAFAFDLTRLLVTAEGVERATAVGDLEVSFRALHRPQGDRALRHDTGGDR